MSEKLYLKIAQNDVFRYFYIYTTNERAQYVKNYKNDLRLGFSES